MLLRTTQSGLGIARTSRTWALAALTAAVPVAAATMVLNRTGGNDLGPLATCWFHAGTGLHCPFCGSLRAVAALSHGDVVVGLHDNAPVLVLLAVGTLIWGRRVLSAWARRNVDRPRIAGRTYLVVGLFFLAFTVYRNTPYGAWLAPLS